MFMTDAPVGCLSADPYGYINAYKGVDLKTGRLIPVPEKEPKEGRVVRNICPGRPGAKDWNPSAFSPVTGLVYIPHLNLCMDMGVKKANYIPGTPFVGADVKMYAGPGGNRGVFTAWDPVARRKVFEIKEDLPLWSPALATAGGAGFLRNDGRLVQSRRRAHRQAAVAVQDRQRDHRSADQLSRAGRAAIYRRTFGRRRLGGRDRVGEPRRARPDGGARLRQCGEGSAEARPRQGGTCSMSSRFRDSLHCRGVARAALRLRPRGTADARQAAGRDCSDGRQSDTVFPGGANLPPLDPRAASL